jgi:hypothetical protein
MRLKVYTDYIYSYNCWISPLAMSRSRLSILIGWQVWQNNLNSLAPSNWLDLFPMGKMTGFGTWVLSPFFLYIAIKILNDKVIFMFKTTFYHFNYIGLHPSKLYPFKADATVDRRSFLPIFYSA